MIEFDVDMGYLLECDELAEDIATMGGKDASELRAKVKAQSDYIDKLRGEYKALDGQMERRCAEYRDTIRKLKAELDAATVGKDIERYDGSGRRGTVAILQGGRKPEEVLFVRNEGGVTHYLPEDATAGAGTCKRVYHPNRITKTCTCSNCGYGASDERWAYCPKCGHKYVHGEVEERWKRAGRKVAE